MAKIHSEEMTVRVMANLMSAEITTMEPAITCNNLLINKIMTNLVNERSVL